MFENKDSHQHCIRREPAIRHFIAVSISKQNRHATAWPSASLLSRILVSRSESTHCLYNALLAQICENMRDAGIGFYWLAESSLPDLAPRCRDQRCWMAATGSIGPSPRPPPSMRQETWGGMASLFIYMYRRGWVREARGLYRRCRCKTEGARQQAETKRSEEQE